MQGIGIPGSGARGINMGASGVGAGRAGERDLSLLKIPMVSPLAHTDPPSVSAVNAVVLTAVGEEAVLQCSVSGVPPPRVIWYRGEFNGEKPRKRPPQPWTYSFLKGHWQAGTPNREGGEDCHRRANWFQQLYPCSFIGC